MTAAVRTSYGALWAATALGALTAGLAGIELAHAAAPHDALDASIGTAIDLLVHNVLVALWPLALVALRWTEIPGARSAGDVLVAGQLVLHGLLVGGAIGQRPELWRYLPHLPLEWLGLALPAAGWLLARREDLGHRVIGALGGTSTAALVVAAVLETWAVPL